MAQVQEKPPYLGFGLGLRPQHYSEILEGNPKVDWFEIISENYMVPGGRPLTMLEKIRARYPIVMHGVSLSVASAAPLDLEYLAGVKRLAARTEPAWVSDHLCWTGVHGYNLHGLLPVPYTQEALEHVVPRLHKVQEVLGRPLAIENVSSYVSYARADMTEWEFLTALVRRTGCQLLFDVNNVFVGAFNHGYDPLAFIHGVPQEAVVQFHLAGHTDMGTYVIDTHDHPIRPEVWDLFQASAKRFGPISTMIERDANIPPLAELVAELDQARRIAAAALTGRKEQALCAAE
jgi:uncharacterized protein